MNILKNHCNKNLKKKSDEAFTYVEVLVSLLIIALLAGLLYFSYAISIKSIKTSQLTLKTAIERLNTDLLIRQKVEQISIPFWYKSYDYSFTSNTLTLSWINGVRNSETINVPDYISIIEVNPINTDSNESKGLQIIYNLHQRTYELKAFFASRPYGSIQL